MRRRFAWLILLSCLMAGSAQAWDPNFAAEREKFAQAQAAAAAGKTTTAKALYGELARGAWPAADLAAVRARELAARAKRESEVLEWNRVLADRFPTSRHHPEALLALARDALDNGRGKEAVGFVKRAISAHPGYEPAKASYFLGEALAAVGESKPAVVAYAQAAYWHHDDYANKSAVRLAEWKKRGIEPAKPSPSAMWAKIDENLARKFYWTAGAFADRYARLFAGTPQAFRAKLASADTLIARRNHNDAKKRLQALRAAAVTKDQTTAVAVRQKRYDTNASSAQKRAYYTPIANKPASWKSRIDARLALFQLEWDAREYAAAAKWGDLLLDEDAGELFVVEQVHWQTAFAHYLAGDFDKAASRLQGWVATYPLHGDHDRASYWLGRALEKKGDQRGAVPAYQACFDRWQGTYYGVAAQARLVALGVPEGRLPAIPFTGEASLAIASGTELFPLKPEWEQPNGGGTTLAGGAQAAIDAFAATNDAEYGPVFRAVRELIAVGEEMEAEDTLDFWKDRLYEDPIAPYFLSVAYGLTGDNLDSVRAAYRALEMVRDHRLADPHGLTARRRFPKIEEPLITATAKKHGLDPYLVFGIIKQESAFQTRATSHAGARGLMQVMPGTGQYIARRRGMKNFNTKNLYKPEVSLDFGCWLMAMLKNKFAEDLPAALAGYNAGWGRPPQWWPPNVGRSYDELIELIPFGETRGYVMGILRNYEMYQRLYRDPANPDKKRPSELVLLGREVKGLP